MISLTGNKEGVEHVDVSDTKRRTRTIWSRYFSSSFFLSKQARSVATIACRLGVSQPSGLLELAEFLKIESLPQFPAFSSPWRAPFVSLEYVFEFSAIASVTSVSEQLNRRHQERTKLKQTGCYYGRRRVTGSRRQIVRSPFSLSCKDCETCPHRRGSPSEVAHLFSPWDSSDTC
jgi:hypothetical protein